MDGWKVRFGRGGNRSPWAWWIAVTLSGAAAALGADDREPIGEGVHERLIINVERFDARMQKKLGASRGGAGA